MKRLLIGEKNWTLITFFCLGLMVFHGTYAQKSHYNFKRLSTREGLSQSTVFSILQDRDGFMWIGTRTGGLNKYDGYSFTQYIKDADDPNTISGNEIISLFEDSKGTLWVGTRNGGLNRYHSDLDVFERYYFDENDTTSIADNTISDIYEDNDHRIWFATKMGLCSYNPAQNNFSRISQLNGMPIDYLSSICGVGEDLLCIGSKEGAILFNRKTNQLVKMFVHDENDVNSIGKGSVDNVLYDEQGRLWLTNRKSGLNRLDDINTGKFTRYTYNKDDEYGSINNIIRSLDQDREGNLWLGSKAGLAKLSVDQLDQQDPVFEYIRNNENDDRSLSQNSIYSFCEDRNGNFWIGTWSGGLNYLNNGVQKFKHYKHLLNDEATISNNLVSSFAHTKQGLWVGTEGGGLNLYDEQTQRFTAIRHDKGDSKSISSDHVQSMLIDSDGDLWIGTYDGLNLYDETAHSFSHYFKGASVYSITEGEIGELWIGCSNGLIKLLKSEMSSTKYDNPTKSPTGISENAVTTVFKDSDGEIWIGTRNGLNKYVDKTNSFQTYFHSDEDRSTLSHNFITTIAQDNDGNLWVGTFDGLNKLNVNKSTFVNYGKKEGLPDNVVSNLIFDEHNSLWLTTNKGLCKVSFDPSNDQKLTTRNYDLRDGLQDYEFIMNASYKAPDGRLYFGGINGFNVFDPNKMFDHKGIPKIAFTEFKIYNKDIEVGTKGSPLIKHISKTKKLSLSHSQSVITFGFVALNFTSSEKNEYAYKMEGFDEDWTYVGTKREAHYTNLPADSYIFRVIGSNNDGVWNEEGASIIVKIQPPWWATWWFRGVLILLAVWVGVWLYRYTSRKIKSDKLFLERKVAEATDEIKNQAKALLELNHNQESIIEERTNKIKEQNKKLIEYVFINSHLVRGPLSRVLGLLNLQKGGGQLNTEDTFKYIEDSIHEMDEVITKVAKKLEEEGYKA